MATDPIFDTDAMLEWSYAVGLFDFMNSKWGWPTIESLHFIGLTLLIGTVGLFDLRALGLVKFISLSSLHKMVPIGVAGFVLNAVTGTMFVMSAPAQYLHNPAFQLKAMCIAIAGINLCAFYAMRAQERRQLVSGKSISAPDFIPAYVKIAAIVSLVSWTGVITFGRLLTFFRPPYFWCVWC